MCSANMGAIVFEPPQDDVDTTEKTPAMVEYEEALENGVCLNTSLAGTVYLLLSYLPTPRTYLPSQ